MDLPLIEEDEVEVERGDNPDKEGDPPPPKKRPLPAPYIVGEGLPVVPPRLVAKIQKGEFLDMAELLKDNIEAERRRLSSSGGLMASLIQATARHAQRREVPDLMSWVQCFGMYASVLSEVHPELRKGLWAYQTMIVREARRSNFRGWQEYDMMFRQQEASAADLKWGSINNALYAVTFAAPQPMLPEKAAKGGITICRHCQEPDHASGDCALAIGLGLDKGSRGRDSLRQARRQSHTVMRPCFAWNSGRCTYMDCRFHHVCSVKGCGGHHRASECQRSGKLVDRRPGDKP